MATTTTTATSGSSSAAVVVDGFQLFDFLLVSLLSVASVLLRLPHPVVLALACWRPCVAVASAVIVAVAALSGVCVRRRSSFVAVVVDSCSSIVSPVAGSCWSADLSPVAVAHPTLRSNGIPAVAAIVFVVAAVVFVVAAVVFVVAAVVFVGAAVVFAVVAAAAVVVRSLFRPPADFLLLSTLHHPQHFPHTRHFPPVPRDHAQCMRRVGYQLLLLVFGESQGVLVPKGVLERVSAILRDSCFML